MSDTFDAPIFEELAFSDTRIGEISLRRRTEPRAENQLVYEIKLGDEFLMSSLFTTGERALASLALSELSGEALDVVVGGLGLGFTAAAALDDERVANLLVIDLLGPVIEWHRNALVPLGKRLTEDTRCRLLCGDFFALAQDPVAGFDYENPGRGYDAILLDVDHSTESWLSGVNRSFYDEAGLAAAARQLRPGGMFAMWSNDPADAAFLRRLQTVFESARAETVCFDNPYTGEGASCTIYLARCST